MNEIPVFIIGSLLKINNIYCRKITFKILNCGSRCVPLCIRKNSSILTSKRTVIESILIEFVIISSYRHRFPNNAMLSVEFKTDDPSLLIFDIF